MARSRPMRARGLKLAEEGDLLGERQSRPMRARGLKQLHPERRDELRLVAPHAGAWIETRITPSATWPNCWARPMRARGLKPAMAAR